MASKSSKRKKRYFGSVYQRKSRPGFYIRYTHHGRRYVRHGGDTRDEAEKELADTFLRISSGLPHDLPEPDRSVLFGDFLTEHVQLLESEHTESTFRSERDRLNNVIEPFFEGRLLIEIRTRDIEKFLLRRSKKGAKPATRNRYASLISRLFERAKAYGLVDDNPVRHIKKQREQERPVPALALKEQDALLDACEERLREYVLLGLDTGCRQGELLALEWKDVDLIRGELTVRKAKGGKTRIVPLTNRLRRRLVELRAIHREEGHAHDRVLFMLPRTWNGRLRARFKKAAAVVGYPDLRPHDLRHCCAVNLVRAGVPLPDVGKWLGHESGSISVTMRYAKHQPENAAHAARDKLDQSRNRVEESRVRYCAA
jgi:integrase